MALIVPAAEECSLVPAESYMACASHLKIRHVLPAPLKQAGGIRSAIDGLSSSLRAHGVDVLQSGSVDDAEAIHHFHGLWDPAHNRLAARLRRRDQPYVVSPHGMLEPWAFRHRRWKKAPYFYLMERRYLRGANALFVTSEMEAENLRRVIVHPRIEVIALGCHDPRRPNYEAARQELGIPKATRLLLFLGRVDVKKGLDLLLEALAINGCDHGSHLIVVGAGDTRYVNMLKGMEARCSRQGLTIDWVGPVWGAGRWCYFQAADLFCLPTHSENFGIAVLEALYAGTPVLTTDRTPWARMGNVDGIFIAKPEVRSICSVLLDAYERLDRKWSSANREELSDWAERNFGWSKLVREYIDAYRRSGFGQGVGAANG